MRNRLPGKDNTGISEAGPGTWQHGSGWTGVGERTAADMLSSVTDTGQTREILPA